MAETSYSVTNLYGEAREFTLLVSTIGGKPVRGPVLQDKIIPRGGFIHRSPTPSLVVLFRYIKVIAKDATTEAKLHVKTPRAVARVEVRLTPKGELKLVARGPDWKAVAAEPVDEDDGIIWPPPPRP